MFGLDPASWYALVAITVLGACFQGSVGFGLSFTIVPFLSVFEPVAIPTVPLLVAIPLLVATVWHDFQHLDARGSAWLILGRLPGTVVGGVLLWIISPQLLAILVGLLLLGSVVTSSTGISLRLNRQTQVTAGFASGVMGTAAGIGGPPISMVYRDASAATMRATASAALFVGVFMSMTAVVVTHRWDQAHVALAASLLPAAAVGFLLSRVVNRHLSRIVLQRVVLTLAAAAGVGSIAQALL